MVSPKKPEDATVLMMAAAGGDKVAADQLYPLVFEQLRRAAQKQMAAERPDHTLGATALVHEAYLKLAGTRQVPWEGRGHYYAAAAQAMRQILVDHARARVAHIRGGPDARRAALELDSLPDPDSEKENAGFLVLHEALSRLEDVDEAADVDSGHGYEPGLPPLGEASGDDVEHGGPGDHEEDQRGPDEHGECGPLGHRRRLPGRGWRLSLRFMSGCGTMTVPA